MSDEVMNLSNEWTVDVEEDRVAGNIRLQSHAPMHVAGPPHAFPRVQWPIGATISIAGSEHNDRQYTIIANDWVFACYLTLDPPPTTEEWTADTMITVTLDAPAPGALAPPVNVDVPHAAQELDVLTCTMGNWEGEPSSYTYQWDRDDAPAMGSGATYAVLPDDIGHEFTCIVTASNAAGATAAPPSNAIVVEDIPAADDPAAERAATRSHHRQHR
jgi:hypothetical protein